MNKGWVAMPVGQLVKADWNYKEEDENKLKKLKANIKRNGMIENLIVRELKENTYEVVNGNHRLDVVIDLKHEEIMVFNLGVIPDADARRIAIETNETKFTVDNKKLAHILLDLIDEFGKDDLLESMPYDDKQLDNFEKILSFDWSSDTTEDPTKSELIKLKLPKDIAEELLAQIDRFKKLLFPAEKITDVSYVTPIKAMAQIIASHDDEYLEKVIYGEDEFEDDIVEEKGIEEEELEEDTI